ncbi:hypothetical protein ID866_9379 [Astraeus odoratus]|nr:hypothetical protein ID866_9379 [Astraeus odoratus]
MMALSARTKSLTTALATWPNMASRTNRQVLW